MITRSLLFRMNHSLVGSIERRHCANLHSPVWPIRLLPRWLSFRLPSASTPLSLSSMSFETARTELYNRNSAAADCTYIRQHHCAHILATRSSPIFPSSLASSASSNATKLSTVPKSSPIRAMISLTRLVAAPPQH
jgi:hypothetical protein